MIKRSLLFLCLAGAVAACGDGGGNEVATNEAENNQAEARQTIGETLAGASDHSAFVEAIQSAGLAETLRGAGPYTVFAPTNAAFEAIPEEVRSELTSQAQRERLTNLLSYHIVPGTVTLEDLGRAIEQGPGGRAELATVTGRNLSVARNGDSIVLTDGAGGTASVAPDEQIGSNGVVHPIDAVLMPGD